MRRFMQTVITIIFIVIILPGGQVNAAPRLQDIVPDEKVVIVIDPGHGGENLGTTENNHTEKFMTMTTALAMYEELLLYDNVEVYLTHRDDRDISLKKRAEFAASVDADFLFSIHYNASENHEMYGAEVWVSVFPPYNGYGYQFGCEILADIRETGLLLRGVKTRFNSQGEDYYGILRESANLGVPAVIIEHCHVDEERDAVYCDNDEKLQAFGRMDATAAARYFGLKSSVLNVDYSNYPLWEANGEAAVRETLNDTSAPDVCRIDFSALDAEKGSLVLDVTAADVDSALLYYSYSLDGGRTFSVRESWPDSDALTGDYQETFTLRLEIPPDIKPEVMVRAYNQYDLYTESNLCNVEEEVLLMQQSQSSTIHEADVPDEAMKDLILIDIAPEGGSIPASADSEEAGESNINFTGLLALCFGLASLVMMILTIWQGIAYHNRRKGRSNRL